MAAQRRGFLGLLRSPGEIRGDRELDLRPPAVGLARPEPVPPGGVFFVIVVLAGVAFDGLLETPVWNELRRATSMPNTVGLVTLPLVFLAVYGGFVKLSRFFGGGSGGSRRPTSTRSCP